MELACRRPPIVLDGAHTPLSTSRTADLFTRLFPGRRILLFGSVHGKDPASMAANLAQTFDTIIVTTPGTFKKSDPEGVYGEFVSRNPNTRLIADPVKALAAAISESRGETPILVTGSFYTVGVIRPLALKKREPEET
jgi:dihydrofolate synthase/folylpolyglutamate synthase